MEENTQIRYDGINDDKDLDFNSNDDYVEDITDYVPEDEEYIPDDTYAEDDYFVDDETQNHAYVFTAASILDLLSQIKELKQYDLSWQEVDGDLFLHVGDSSYKLDLDNAENIEVDDEVIDDVQDANAEGFDQIPDLVTTDDSATVEAGPIANLLKTLTIGGIVRFGNKILKDDMAK